MKAVLGCAVMALGLAGFVLVIAALILLIGLSAWALPLGALGSGLIWGSWRLVRRDAPVTQWDAAITAALIALPPGTKVRRSGAGQPAVAKIAAWIVYASGLAVAFLEMLSEEDERLLPYLIVGVTGFMAGALLSVARDGRGRRAGTWALLVLAGLLPALLLGMGWEAASARGEAELLLLQVLTFGAATGIPVIVGYIVPRGLVAVYRLTRAVPALPPVVEEPLAPELEAATAHRTARAVVRTYNLDEDGMTLFLEDRTALGSAGYEVAATCQSGDNATGIHLAFVTLGAEGNLLRALFVPKEVGAFEERVGTQSRLRAHSLRG